MSGLLDEDWKFLGTWPSISLNDSLIWQGPEATARFHEEFGVWKGCANVFTEAGQTQHLFIPARLSEELQQHLDVLMQLEPGRIASRISRYYESVASYELGTRRLTELGTAAENSVLAEAFVAGRRLQHEMAIFDQFGILSEPYFMARIDAMLESRVADREGRFKHFDVLTAPWTLSTPQREQQAVLRLLVALTESEDFRAAAAGKDARRLRLLTMSKAVDAIDYLVEHFGWMPVFLRNPVWSRDHYIRQIVETAAEHGDDLLPYLSDQLDLLDRLPEDRRHRAVAATEDLALTEPERAAVETFRLVIDARNEAEYRIGQGSLALGPIMAEIALRLDLDEATLHTMYADEIAQVLTGSRALQSVPIRERLEVTGYWYPDGQKLAEMTREEAQCLLERRERAYDSPSMAEGDERRGICASLGKAYGPARIIAGVGDFAKFRSGDILVAESTTADYVPLMRRAAGVITEHGGITCHAAIVARELGIPAIVGYPRATRVFHDGQLLTFDALDGQVHTLS